MQTNLSDSSSKRITLQVYRPTTTLNNKVAEIYRIPVIAALDESYRYSYKYRPCDKEL